MLLHRTVADRGDLRGPERQGCGAGQPVLGWTSKFGPDTPQFPLQHQSYTSIQ